MTLQVAVLPPSDVFAVITVLPSSKGVMTPLLFTVATEVSLLVQKTVLSVALSGNTVAVKAIPVSLVKTSSVDLSSVTEATGTIEDEFSLLL